MFNSGGAIEALKSFNNQSGYVVKIQERGCGLFGTYSNIKPSYCIVDKAKVDFTFDTSNGMLKFELQGDCKVRQVNVASQEFDVTSSFSPACVFESGPVQAVCQVAVKQLSCVIRIKCNVICVVRTSFAYCSQKILEKHGVFLAKC